MGTILVFTVEGPPKGSERARSKGRMRFHSEAHNLALGALVQAAIRADDFEGMRATPVRVVIETWHRRPKKKANTRAMRGAPEVPFKGKPDADNIAKLVMDACTRAGVWTDDTVVAQLEVRRWWVAVDEDGEQGPEKTTVSVEAL